MKYQKFNEELLADVNSHFGAIFSFFPPLQITIGFVTFSLCYRRERIKTHSIQAVSSLFSLIHDIIFFPK